MHQILVYADSLSWGMIPETRKRPSTAHDSGCFFFDAGAVTAASRVDGIHSDADQHRQLGEALAAYLDALPVWAA